MKIPSKLKIGAQEYTIEMVSADNLENGVGESSCATNIIKIRQDIPQTQKEETLLHEVIHAVNGGLSEPVVDGISHSLYQVLRDNSLLK